MPFSPTVSRGIAGVVVAAVGAMVAAAPGRAAEPYNMRVNLASVRMGGIVSGTLPAAGLGRRVVAIEHWTTSCPECKASLPKLGELQTAHRQAGLVVIGAVRPGTDPAKVKEVVAETATTFPIVNGADLAGGNDFKTVPHLMVFDHTGRCLFRGLPDDGYEVITAAVRASPASILEGRTLTKLASLQPSLLDDAGLATALRKARGYLKSADEATVEEARYVVEKVEAFGRRLLDDAAAAKTSDPLRAVALVQRCAADFKGTPLGAEAASLAKDWNKNPTFQKALAAVNDFAQLQAIRSQVLASFRAVGTATPDIVARVPPAVKQQMTDLVAKVQENLPGSKFANEANDIAIEFSLPVKAGQPAP